MDARDLPKGTVIDDFVVERKLSEGGMGAVYVVVQKSTEQRRALKVMMPELVQDADMRRRFAQEARVGARIESEHAVHVVAAGVDPVHQMPWLAMELLEGETLQARLKRGPLAPSELVSVYGELCHALGAAHRAGIVHRDLKPENIFLAKRRDRTGGTTVKVLDFGIAKILQEGTTGEKSKAAIGTWPFMAPEQWDPNREKTPATDVWALGVIAFQLLTGRLFWKASNQAEQVGELFASTYPAPSARARELGSVAPPPWFDRWFARCVQKEPGARYRDAEQALVALEAAFDAASATPLPGPPGPQPTVPQGPVLPLASPAPPAPANLVPAPPPQRSKGSALTPRLLAGLAVGGTLGLVVWTVGSRKSSNDGVHPDPPPPSVTATAIASVPPPPPSDGCPVGMVKIPGATEFWMGSEPGEKDSSDDERPKTRVALKDFCLDRTEVTAGAYAKCVAASGCNAAPQSQTSDTCTGGKAGMEQHPINCVDWNEAKAFCSWREQGKGRLPSEAEWEFAARGLERRKYPWGNLPEPDQNLATVSGGKTLRLLNACGSECYSSPMYPRDDGFKATAPVGSFLDGDTPLGLHDMAGNVWEWVEDEYCETYERKKCTQDRINRGGRWGSSVSAGVRGADRSRSAPETRSNVIGFRCARDYL